MMCALKITIAALAGLILAAVIYFLVPQNGDTSPTKKPNIVIIMADDMGHNDVGFLGSNQIPTPNIDALAYNGIILDKFYTQFACTPSRTALLTGNYPLRYGMHGSPITAGDNRSLSEGVTLMPQHLKRLGYKTHLVGKWHLGAAYRHNTPTMRGFDSHFGYWNGFVGYFNYRAMVEMDDGSMVTGLDLHEGFEPIWSTQGKYATELFTEKALDVIENHNKENPLFLLVAHLAPHTGWDGIELGVPNVTENDLKFSYIKDPKRRLYAGVVSAMDDSVGSIIKKLSDRNMLENSIVLFFSDNGAPTTGVYLNAGSNWPLRGIKMSDFEGGVRTAAAMFSPLLQKSGYVSKQIVHLVDWLPTLYAAAGGSLQDLGELDGINQWSTLSENQTTKRREAILNVNGIVNTSAIISGRYKYLQGSYDSGRADHYAGESGRGVEVPPYDDNAVFNSTVYQAFKNIVINPLTSEKISELRTQTDLAWCRNENQTYQLNCNEGCLFDLEADPCETTNIIDMKKDTGERLRLRLKDYEKVLVLQSPQTFDPLSNPVYYNDTWCTWLDDNIQKTINSK